MNAEGREKIQDVLNGCGAAVLTRLEEGDDSPYVSVRVATSTWGARDPGAVINMLAKAGLLVGNASRTMDVYDTDGPRLQVVGCGDSTVTFKDLNARFTPDDECETRD